MRPKLLEIEGLQSFRDYQKIDFERLGETGLFGIFGPTGSGKSTVLDAITFTLFGKVKRAERGTQGIINTNHKTAKVAFTFELTKEGSRKTYRVERTYQRKKDSENACEPKVVRLLEVTDVGDIPLCDKASEVSSRIEELLGLSHDDFTRAVVLPQNSFQEFLLLDNKQKRDMLERIFYLEEYGKQLTEKLARKMSRLKLRLEKLSGELQAYNDATDEAVAAAGEKLQQALAERAQLEAELKLLEAKFNEAKEVWGLVQELKVIGEQEKEHLTLKDSVAEKRLKLEQAVKADGLLEIIRKKKELGQKLQETEQQLQEVISQLPAVSSNLMEVKQKQQSLKSEAATKQPQLVSLRTRLTDALGVKTEIKGIEDKIKSLLAEAAKLAEDIAVKNKAIAGENAGSAKLEEQLKELRREMVPLQVTPEYRQLMQSGLELENDAKTLAGKAKEQQEEKEKLNEIVSRQQQELQGISQRVFKAQADLNALQAEMENHSANRPEDRNRLLQFQDELHKLESVCNTLLLRKKGIDDIAAKQVIQQKDLESLSENLVQREKEKAAAESSCAEARLRMEQAVVALNQNTAYMLAKNLQEGEACPVCGSLHHPKPAVFAGGMENNALEKEVENAQARVRAAENTLKRAEHAVLLEGEKLKSLKEQYGQTAKELTVKTAEYDAEKNKLPEELRALEPKELHEQLADKNKLTQEKLQAVEIWEQKQAQYQTELQKLGELLSKEKLAEAEISAKLKVNTENSEKAAAAFKAAVERFQAARQRYKQFLAENKISAVAAELERLNQNDRKLHTLQQRQEELIKMIDGKKETVERLNQELAALNSKKLVLEADKENLSAQSKEKQVKLKELAGEADIEAEIKQIDAKLREYISLQEQYEQSVKALEGRYNTLIASKGTLENQKQIYTESHQSENKKLNDALLAKGFTDSDEVERAVLAKEQQQALAAEIERYEQEESRLKLQKNLALRKLDSRMITEEEWKGISNSYRETAARKEECVSQSEVARNNYQIVKTRHEKWRELQNSHSQLANKYDLLDQIQRLLRGDRGKDNSFIDFIAEERLRYVAAKASETLAAMTKYRYGLELDANSGFIIRDNANGGVHRMVTSLSGGETFLTSLSLALALSEQIQLKGQSPLEFFFLDEGFGTLDNNLLDTVIDALERLSKKERVIGLISHVPELRSRIARRLVVEPPTSQGEGSRVKIEMA